jgi:hypothetical protein
MTNSKATILDCGHPTTVTQDELFPGTAITSDGRTSCYSCAEQNERTAFDLAGSERKPFTAYLTGDVKVKGSLKVTTWTGAELATVLNAHPIALTRTSFTHGKTILAYTARDAQGRLWYGRGNPGIVTTLRRKGA